MTKYHPCLRTKNIKTPYETHSEHIECGRVYLWRIEQLPVCRSCTRFPRINTLRFALRASFASSHSEVMLFYWSFVYKRWDLQIKDKLSCTTSFCLLQFHLTFLYVVVYIVYTYMIFYRNSAYTSYFENLMVWIKKTSKEPLDPRQTWGSGRDEG